MPDLTWPGSCGVGMSGGAWGARQPMPGAQAVKIKRKWGLPLLLGCLMRGREEGLWARTGSSPGVPHRALSPWFVPAKLCDLSQTLPSGSLYPFEPSSGAGRCKAWSVRQAGEWSSEGGDSALPTGPVSSILVTRFGCRPVMLVGGLLASAGMVLASFATRLLELYLTAGVLTGEGALRGGAVGGGWES